jgi:histidine triad (HIT) family protein
VHVLIIPKQHIATLSTWARAHGLLGRMLALAPRLMRELGVTNGFRTLINTGADGGRK